ncbi:response regulator transcription factor, partial [Glutamicibacter ardleyensis]
SLNGNDIYRAIHLIVTESPNTSVAVLATKYDRAEALLAYSAGSSALISKSSISEELPSTLRLIANGYKIFAAPHDGWEIVSLSPHRTQNQSIIEALNDRDRRLIYSVAAGLTNTQISRTLHISEGSVKLHLARLMDELNVSNRVQLAVIATENGLITSADLKTA